MARTPRVVEDRREQIIDAAMRVFSQKGFSRATNKDIAREIGITPGLIYHYFESKEALLKEVIYTLSPAQIVSNLPEAFYQLPPREMFPLLLGQILDRVEQPEFIRLIRILIPELI